MKRQRKNQDEKKEMCRGYFWTGGGRSGFVGRLQTEHHPHNDDLQRAGSLASTWGMVARLEARRRALGL